jgi:hypothetical protein
VLTAMNGRWFRYSRLSMLVAVMMFSLVNTTVAIDPVPISLSSGDSSSGAFQFELATVTVLTRSPSGDPLSGINVKAFSEEWGWRVPDWGFSQTATDGKVAFRLTKGRWSFFAIGGNAYSPGEGYFAAVTYFKVSADTNVMLQPTSTITVQASDPQGNGLSYAAVRAMDSAHTPIVHTDNVGTTSASGTITLHVSSDLSYDILVWSSSTPSYAFLRKAVPAGTMVSLSAGASSMAHLHVESFDTAGSAFGAWLYVNYNRFDVGENTGLATVPFHINGVLDLYSSPSEVTMVAVQDNGEWCYRYRPMDYSLSAGQSLSITFGGPLTFKVYVQQDQSQIWFRVTDHYGHDLSWYWQDGLQTKIHLSLTRDGSTILEKDLTDFFSALGTTYENLNSPSYSADGADGRPSTVRDPSLIRDKPSLQDNDDCSP